MKKTVGCWLQQFAQQLVLQSQPTSQEGSNVSLLCIGSKYGGTNTLKESIGRTKKTL
jgi:hypothetical protein